MALWGCDFTFEDYGILDEQGIVHELHCTNCGAEIVYYCKEEDEESDGHKDLLQGGVSGKS